MEQDNRLKFSLNIAVVSGIFCITVALLLLLNFMQMAKNKPLESKALTSLVKRLSQEPNSDELKQEIRNFDLLARKAYFNSQWQVKTGGYLLLFGAIVFALSLRVFIGIKSKIGEPEVKDENDLTSRIMTQRWVMITGSVLVVLGLAASFASVDHLKKYDVKAALTEAKSSDNQDSVEVIKVGENPQVVQSATIDTTKSVIAVNATKTDATKTDTASVVPVAAAKIIFPGSNAIKANAPGFRGPFGNGVFFQKGTPVEWDAATGKNVIWKTPVPKKGYNSPVIWGNKVFLSGADNQSREVYCFDRNSGKVLWKQLVDKIQGSPATAPKVTEDTGFAAPSLTTDGNRVYAMFADGDIICFDMDGNRVWARNLGLPDNHYGHASSLIMYKDKVYIQYDTNKSRKLIALNASTGETTWETVRKGKISWASPILAEINGKFQVVLSTDPMVAGYDPETGKELWSVDCMSGEVGPSPASGGGMVFAVNEYAKLVCIDPSKNAKVWENDEFLAEVASPVTANGLLFVATTYGVLACYDAKSGEKYWSKEEGAGYYSSPVIADNKVYTFDTTGKMRVFDLGKEAKIIGEGNAAEKMTTTPAFANGRMFVRTPKFLYCVGTK
ncbi:MAG TPA: PQQ-binding-like beta-propeller repeat protein [Prolixibacteraceae bacterium]|nr:PQQ-binding-like beta-propeller repeat protein [Prolixibacteraceae bacterium]